MIVRGVAELIVRVAVAVPLSSVTAVPVTVAPESLVANDTVRPFIAVLDASFATAEIVTGEEIAEGSTDEGLAASCKLAGDVDVALEKPLPPCPPAPPPPHATSDTLTASAAMRANPLPSQLPNPVCII